jgi:hypothetical protein
MKGFALSRGRDGAVTSQDVRDADARRRADLIDPLGAERLGDGTLRARRITDKEAFKLYGNT